MLTITGLDPTSFSTGEKKKIKSPLTTKKGILGAMGPACKKPCGVGL